MPSAPHPPRPGGAAMFSRIAPRYDLLNGLLSLGLDRVWRRRAAAALPERCPRVLDLAAGTGDQAIADLRARPGGRVDAVDPSPEMLDRARRKAADAGLSSISFQVAAAEGLPFDDAVFDAATCAFGVRNFEDRPRALRELRRVLRPQARLVVLELTRPRAPVFRGLHALYCHSAVPLAGRILAGDARAYRYLDRSVAAFDAHRFRGTMEAAGFGNVRVNPLTFGAVTVFTGERVTP
ncbi:ubiquinone/menaquinone biosynthesis methyltransferase [Kiritimatiella glycovorans]|uniref:Demethylmenaquinone methyltransferase n=1 Tax=Kiritimatiella glycovorans TaxID=1307763 RepID=A0A0G3EJQ6_9BACT|nr:ubiquinone/menaquinone biosynthesis methyltransferase [Kiritimatiella glycovorans]AKJ65025.1 Demethylmenaquinone methyltransferase [Kiritimatiella glycovorans]